jgi:acyl carrier protein
MITDALLHQCSTIDVNSDMFFALDSSVLDSLGALELGSRALQDQFMLQFYDANQCKQNYHLNHGSYGAVPKHVLHKQFEMQMWMETHPDRWFRQRSVHCIQLKISTFDTI